MGSEKDAKIRDHSVPDGTNGRSVELKGTSSKVGALAWEHEDWDLRSITNTALIATLSKFRSSMSADLVLCAGTSILLAGAEAAANETPSKDVAKEVYKAAGRPVLLEWPIHPVARKPHRWLLATNDGFEKIRSGQYVVQAAPSKSDVGEVLNELRSELGTIRLTAPTHDTTLVLLLCNEARIFDAVGRSLARLRHKWRSDQVPAVFREPWVMLHPSHSPYWSASKHSGRGLVASWLQTRREPPRPAHFSLLTRRRRTRDGHLWLPAQVIHAGPYQNNPVEADLSVCSFRGGTRTRADVQEAEIADVGRARYAEFDV